MLSLRRIVSVLLAFFLCNSLSLAGPEQRLNGSNANGFDSRLVVPLDLAILIQDDLVSHVGNELKVTGEFIRSLPQGSRVMVGYITVGTLQVRQKFTEDLGKAAASLRIPLSSSSGSPFNPYVEVLEGLERFDSAGGKNHKALLLISDGLDTSRGFHATDILKSIDLERAIREAKEREIPIYSFYAPTRLSSRSRLFAGWGQSSLKRISDETGGEAFFQGLTDFVTFDPYFEGLIEAINRRYADLPPVS